ncbi:MOSC domain-containing protein [Phenylobacterium sp.]|uniref:MOSC domain-containing protein n=1 Tax=Phenylobacterium sp. TaxID=1871053 RepID=UPI0027320BD7|nr:MOSC N-terminal beta barrel domain-containing protein [Phenylobacterium sp.]MDP1617023.1 MOSC domain-containing protein [Phenylobacterium sp.]MDP1986994.1 MOSC domain-containing protein [Phenylobacterium sp.]
MTGQVAALYRHPVKGFTPEQLDRAQLSVGAPFPCDRLFAIENGPSGFDPAAPVFISKQKFAVLAAIPTVARARTRYDDTSGVLHVEAPGHPDLTAPLGDSAGRQAFADWLTRLLGDDVRGPLRVVEAPGHRFMDHPRGDVSIVNLASVRDLEQRLGREIDPLRFRANIYVDGWPAWAENDWAGRDLMVGWAQARVFKPIVRCAAPDVDPHTAERDMEITKALYEHYGHMFCGVYVHVTREGAVAPGDACSQPQDETAAAPRAGVL